ncbi:MAG: hypothetical protein CL681_16100 [Blastopirellula sp.]|nr:hypothetical protein [Blastopirellula sp.]
MFWNDRDPWFARLAELTMLFMVSCCWGCAPAAITEQPAKVVDVAVAPTGKAGLTVAELALELERVYASALETERLLKTPARFRFERLRTELNTGIAIADRLIGHEDVTSRQLEAAWSLKVKLLYRGACRLWTGFDERLEIAALELRETHPDAPVSELADALLVEMEYRVRQSDGVTVREQLARHADRHPRGQTAPRLYLAYSQKLHGEKRDFEAREVLRDGVSRLSQNRAVDDLRSKLAVVDRTQRIETLRKRVVRAELAPLRDKLGGERGVYILQAHEADTANPDYKYEFAVVRGIEEAKRWTDALARDRWKRGWEWRVYRRYPGSDEGWEQARLELHTILKYPELQRAG